MSNEKKDYTQYNNLLTEIVNFNDAQWFIDNAKDIKQHMHDQPSVLIEIMGKPVDVVPNRLIREIFDASLLNDEGLWEFDKFYGENAIFPEERSHMMPIELAVEFEKYKLINEIAKINDAKWFEEQAVYMKQYFNADQTIMLAMMAKSDKIVSNEMIAQCFGVNCLSLTSQWSEIFSKQAPIHPSRLQLIPAEFLKGPGFVANCANKLSNRTAGFFDISLDKFVKFVEPIYEGNIRGMADIVVNAPKVYSVLSAKWKTSNELLAVVIDKNPELLTDEDFVKSISKSTLIGAEVILARNYRINDELTAMIGYAKQTLDNSKRQNPVQHVQSPQVKKPQKRVEEPRPTDSYVKGPDGKIYVRGHVGDPGARR